MIDLGLDGEDLALRALARNASRIRMGTATVALVGAFAVGIPAYWVVRAVLRVMLGINIPIVSAAVGIGIPCVVAILLARGISGGLIRARQEAWIAQLAQQHGVPADRLRESTFIL